MTDAPFSDHDLEAFLDEELAAAEAARLEQALRDNASLRERLLAVIRNRDAGEHSLGAIWRRHRLSCFDRSTLSAYVSGTLAEDERRRLELHLAVVGCRYCAANLDDIRNRTNATSADSATPRSRRIFDSSICRLRKD